MITVGIQHKDKPFVLASLRNWIKPKYRKVRKVLLNVTHIDFEKVSNQSGIVESSKL